MSTDAERKVIIAARAYLATYEHDMRAEYKRGVEDALRRVQELMGRLPYASAHLANIAREFGVETTNVDLSTVTAKQRAQIIREERDALIMAWQGGALNSLLGAERFLNKRVRMLGFKTITGDTTEEV